MIWQKKSGNNYNFIYEIKENRRKLRVKVTNLHEEIVGKIG